jgi:site-specific recombinase XerD
MALVAKDRLKQCVRTVATLVPWACDVLQSKQSLAAYGQDLRDFVAHMEKLNVDPLKISADHIKLYKAALRSAGRSSATIARKLSVLRGVCRQFAEKGLVRCETVQDILAVQSPRVQKTRRRP